MLRQKIDDNIGLFSMPRLPVEVIATLEEPISFQEVCTFIEQMPIVRVSGPDGSCLEYYYDILWHRSFTEA